MRLKEAATAPPLTAPLLGGPLSFGLEVASPRWGVAGDTSREEKVVSTTVARVAGDDRLVAALGDGLTGENAEPSPEPGRMPPARSSPSPAWPSALAHAARQAPPPPSVLTSSSLPTATVRPSQASGGAGRSLPFLWNERTRSSQRRPSGAARKAARAGGGDAGAGPDSAWTAGGPPPGAGPRGGGPSSPPRWRASAAAVWWGEGG